LVVDEKTLKKLEKVLKELEEEGGSHNRSKQMLL